MNNTHFNGLDVNSLLERIIAREEDFKKNDARELGYDVLGMKTPYEELLELLNEGHARAIPYLERHAVNRARSSKDDDERNESESEITFWNTLSYMICEHYYELGDLKYEKHLAYMLLTGTGCERDTERGIKLALSDSERTASSLNADDRAAALDFIEHRKGADEREASIVKAIFDGDREALKVQIDAIRALGDEADIMNGASTLMHCAKFYANKKED